MANATAKLKWHKRDCKLSLSVLSTSATAQILLMSWETSHICNIYKRLCTILTWNRNLVLILLFTWICRLDLSLGFVTWICLNLNWLLAVTGVMHEAIDAYSIRSTWSCYWLDQFLTLALNILILSIFYISMDLSTNYFAHFSGCWASFACSCHYPRMLCHVFWSQVEYKIVCFISAAFAKFWKLCNICNTLKFCKICNIL